MSQRLKKNCRYSWVLKILPRKGVPACCRETALWIELQQHPDCFEFDFLFNFGTSEERLQLTQCAVPTIVYARLLLFTNVYLLISLCS